MHFEDLADNGEFSIKTSLQDLQVMAPSSPLIPPRVFVGHLSLFVFFFFEKCYKCLTVGLAFLCKRIP